MKEYLHNSKGASAIISIIGMTFLGICLAGLIPFVTGLIQTNTSNYNSLQAQYAAEAGAKRAIVSIARNAIEASDNHWDWLNTPRNLTMENDSTKYTVSLMYKANDTANFSSYTPQINTKLPNGIYKVTSVGTVKQNDKTFKSTIYVIGTVLGTGTLDFKSLTWSR